MTLPKSIEAITPRARTRSSRGGRAQQDGARGVLDPAAALVVVMVVAVARHDGLMIRWCDGYRAVRSRSPGGFA